jgi:hypothetical protein
MCDECKTINAMMTREFGNSKPSCSDKERIAQLEEALHLLWMFCAGNARKSMPPADFYEVEAAVRSIYP